METLASNHQKHNRTVNPVPKPGRILNEDQRFVRRIWAKLLNGEEVRVWLAGFNWDVQAITYKRSNIFALTSQGWQLASREAFENVKLLPEFWEGDQPSPAELTRLARQRLPGDGHPRTTADGIPFRTRA